MKRILVTIALILILITSVIGCAPQGEADFTLFIYLCGSTLESNAGSATANITEMLEADIPANTRVVIETGGTKTWRRYDISNEANCRYIVENHELRLVESNVASNMGDANTLTSFLSWGMENYRAKEYGLIMWDHGGGSIAGVCFDEKFAMDPLTHKELGVALESLGSDKKLEFIGFDACLMASIETAKTIRPYTDNMLASEENEPSTGWAYDVILEHLGKDDFYTSVLDSYASKVKKRNLYTLSHVDLVHFDAIEERFDMLIDKMIAEDPRKIIESMGSAIHFGQNDYDYYDLGNIMSFYGDSEPLDGVKCSNGSLREGASGLSVYFPLRDKTRFDGYSALGFYQKYNNFIKDYYASKSNDTVSFINYGENVGNQLKITLTPESMKNVSSVRYALYALEDNGYEGNLTCLGTDDDVNIIDNKIFITFVGRWVRFGGKYLYAEVVEENDTMTLFSADVALGNDYRMATIIFMYDKIERKIELLGARYDDSSGDSLIFDIEEGTRIIPGKLVSLGDFLAYTYEQEDAFIYDSTQKLEVAKLKDGKYQYTAYIKDVYGNNYTAGTAVVTITDGKVNIDEIISSTVEYPEW